MVCTVQVGIDHFFKMTVWFCADFTGDKRTGIVDEHINAARVGEDKCRKIIRSGLLRKISFLYQNINRRYS
jgi:hypothetical protein